MDFTWTLILHSKTKNQTQSNKQTKPQSKQNKKAQQTFLNFIFTLAHVTLSAIIFF